MINVFCFNDERMTAFRLLLDHTHCKLPFGTVRFDRFAINKTRNKVGDFVTWSSLNKFFFIIQ